MVMQYTYPAKKKKKSSNQLENFNLDNTVHVLIGRGRKEEMDAFFHFRLSAVNRGAVDNYMSHPQPFDLAKIPSPLHAS